MDVKDEAMDVDLTNTSSVADLLGSARPLVIDRDELLALDEMELVRVPSAAGSWLAPFSPFVPASSPEALDFGALPAGTLAGLRHAVSIDQVVRQPAAAAPAAAVAAPVGPGAVAPGGGELGPPVSITSSMHLPISAHGSHVFGMVVSDVVLDGFQLGVDMHPVVRWVYDSETDVAHAASVSRSGSFVTAACVKPADDGNGLVITGSVLRRPATPGAPVQLLVRTSTLLQRSEALPPRDCSSPLAAYRDSVMRLVGTFGSAAVLAGIGDSGPPLWDPTRAPDLVTTTVFNDFASASVVHRLQAVVLGQAAVHPGGLRLGPAALGTPGGRGAVAIAPSPPGTLICAAGADETSPSGSWLSAMGVPGGDAAAEGPKSRTRSKVHLEDVTDEAARTRILRNREAARRSNAKRRERRALAMSGS
ncbi:hypothetical protein BU14_0675s0006 [Porphyra umbilicalis]|uniref:BZIP domain-containing protein n=1 Tax=Porphyra umbilicalis TaxID=2786 RepID=A0A1X6NQ90_PORUM|nr:hypothetical protein BU14_0675s0006 [Porphyra umbilicalis]|eukprot:OSX70735.1 hypothetical protein BU14_0675s0006 [Porphyra umbilicalis]